MFYTFFLHNIIECDKSKKDLSVLTEVPCEYIYKANYYSKLF